MALSSLSALQADTLVHVFSFLDEEGVYNLEDAFPKEPLVLSATQRRWRQFAKLDQTRRNSRWALLPSRGGPPTFPGPLPSSSSNEDDDEAACSKASSSSSRRRGRDYHEARSFARQLADEANRIYDFDCEPVPYYYPIPCRHVEVPDETGSAPNRTISPCWEQEWASWTDVTSTTSGYREVFLSLTVRDGTGATATSWEGYRPVQHVSSSEIEISLDIRSLVEEIHWTEMRQYHENLVQIRGKFHQQGYNHYDDLMYMRQLEKLMRRLQITITTTTSSTNTRDGDNNGERHTTRQRGPLLLATGGIHCRAAGSPFCSSAYFHDRCPKRPLATSISGGPYTTCMTITTDDRLVFNIARTMMED